MEKRELILGINPCTYGLNYHDPSVMLVSNGSILFGIEEERVNGIKGSKGKFPEQAIKKCLENCNIRNEDITGVAIGYDPMLWNNRLALELKHIMKNEYEIDSVNYSKTIMNNIMSSNLVNRYGFFSDINNVKNLIKAKMNISNDIIINFYEHHLAHIASAFEVSGFKTATGIVVDGIGETATSTIWKINEGKYEKILEVGYPNSLGYFYAIATKFLGFEPWAHEGKTMALAAYGKKDKNIWDNIQKIINIDGHIYNVGDFVETNATNFLMIDEEKAVKSIEHIMGFSARQKDAPILEAHKNFAWAVQKILEISVQKLVNFGIKETGYKNVCAAGGVFMNCKMNMVIRENTNANNYFVQPLAGDAGLALGASLLMSKKHFKGRLNTLAFGPQYNDDEIENCCRNSNIKYYKSSDIGKDAARLISEGKIICWFQTRMEMGARALGSRSIIADPRINNISDKINLIVKHREEWRPFACSIMEDKANEVFERYKNGDKYPFMIEAFRVKQKWKAKIPAVIHKSDGTSRPQTVSAEIQPLYYSMIQNFYKLSGCPLVLNTSFNDKGQPIIMTPNVAIDFFKKIEVDNLIIGNFIFKRENSKE